MRASAERTPDTRSTGVGDLSGSRVLVTGAAGRIGRAVVADLLDRGYRVRATTSKSSPQDGRAGALEWRHFEVQMSSDYDVLARDCVAVLHIGAEMADPKRM